MGAFKSTVLVCNLLGVRNTTDRVTEEEIRLMIQESARDGDVQEVERIFNLGDRDLESIMTPRGGGGDKLHGRMPRLRNNHAVRGRGPLSVLVLIING